jgi:hypothetical protein
MHQSHTFQLSVHTRQTHDIQDGDMYIYWSGTAFVVLEPSLPSMPCCTCHHHEATAAADAAAGRPARTEADAGQAGPWATR